jgi:hypothetical protein
MQPDGNSNYPWATRQDLSRKNLELVKNKVFRTYDISPRAIGAD